MSEELDKKTWNTRIAVGRMAYDAGYYSQAARHFCIALDYATEHNMPPSCMAINYVSLGKTMASMGNYKETEQYLIKALAIDESLDDHSVDVAADYSELGMLYFKMGRLDESAQCNEKCLQLISAFKEPPAFLYGKVLKQMAILKSEAGDMDGALALVDRALETIEAAHDGKNQLVYGEAMMVKCMLLVDMGRGEEARELYPQAMQIVEMNRGPFHPKVATMMDMFATMTSNAGHPKASEYLKEQAEHIRDFSRRHKL